MEWPQAWEWSVQGLKERLDQGLSLLVVDCREEIEYQYNRLEGALWLPLSEFFLLKEIPENWPIPVCVYCHHGVRSLRAVQCLRELGIEHSYSLAGGIDAWSRQIDPAIPRY